MDPIQQNQNQSQKKSGATGLTAGVIAVLLIAGGAFAYFKNSNTAPSSDQVSTTPADTTNTPADTTNTPIIVTSKYTDGTYSSEGSYQSPGGTETIKVTLVLQNDIVTDATVVSVLAERSESREFQGKFIAGFKQYVIGKNIDEINITKVSGSSLTPKGFNAALVQIKTQAQA